MKHVCHRLRVSGAVVLGMTLATLASCVLPGSRPPARLPPLRVSEVADVGDPARRASQRLVLSGLESDVAQDPERALGSYERAIQVDPGNPYAYLAIARHHAEGDDPEWALSFLDKADALFRAEGGPSERIQPYLVGLRGQVLFESGRVDEGTPLLREAWELAPEVWTDGRLSAEELR